MKNLTCMLSIMFIIATWVPIDAHSADEAEALAMLDNVDGRQALAIANAWRWSQSDITSYITTKEVVFEFPNGTVKRVNLPQDQVMVAVAPYISRTHK